MARPAHALYFVEDLSRNFYVAGMARESVDGQESDRRSAGDPPRVSVIIVNFNGARLLPACLDSLAASTCPNREVIVVDNASSDDSLQVLERYPWVKVVRCERNLGFAGGNNAGLKHCTGDYVLLLNNDTIVDPGFIEPLRDYLTRQPHVAVVQGKMRLPRFGDTLDACGSFLTFLGVPYHYGLYKPDGPKYRRPYPVFSAKGACLMFRRDIINRVGGFLFDEDFFCYYEETDFCHRVWLAGYEVHFVPGPPIQHLMGATAGDPRGPKVLRRYLSNMAFSLMANLSFPSRVRILPFFFALVSASLLLSLLSLRMESAAAYWAVLTGWIPRYGRIRSRRRMIRPLRTRSDRRVFERVLRNPRLSYFIKTFRGDLRSYEDEEFDSRAASASEYGRITST